MDRLEKAEIARHAPQSFGRLLLAFKDFGRRAYQAHLPITNLVCRRTFASISAFARELFKLHSNS
jgi:hypothetical protein